MRDFIHIDDCVAGAIATMDKISDGNAVNLSTGIYTSFIGFAGLAAKLCGYSPEVRGMSQQPAGVHARGGDTQKQIALGFEYKIDFATGVKRALDYYSRYSSPIDAASVPLVPEIPRRTAARTRAYPV
jgi:GDP-L-fucose synthase